MNCICDIQIPNSQKYSIALQNQINFCGVAPVEKLGKDVFVGIRKELIQETAFFREPETIEFVKKYIKTAFNYKPVINILDGACSKGYETYTIAMMLDEIPQKINLIGFDIGKKAINDAKKGVFFIKQVSGTEETVSAYKYGMAAFNDDYLAFPQTKALSAKQEEYKQLFHKFFTEIPDYKEKIPLYNRLREKFFPETTPHFETKAFQIKPEKANCCDFFYCDILKLDKLFPKKIADVLFFRNALYHLTTKRGPLDFKLARPNEVLIPTLENVVNQIDRTITKNGLFVLGEHYCDHTNMESGKILYKTLEKHNFSPVYFNSDGSMAYIWKKN